MERSGIIPLITDFGLSDPYVAIMKGVIWGIYPQARLVDLTHQVHPQNILQGGFLLASAQRYFPPGTIHLAVVDPGVGTDRPVIALETPTAGFVAPDNGLLTFVWEELSTGERADSHIVELDEPRYWLPQVSATFHGRDIMAPVAAHLSAGVALGQVGRPRKEMVLLEGTRPSVQDDGTVVGQIVHIDRFGNCISNIAADWTAAMAAPGPLHLQVQDCRLDGIARTYADGQPGQPLALIGSSGRLEVAVRAGSAATELDIAIGDPIYVWSASARGG